MVSHRCGFFHESTNDKTNLGVLSDFEELSDPSHKCEFFHESLNDQTDGISCHTLSS